MYSCTGEVRIDMHACMARPRRPARGPSGGAGVDRDDAADPRGVFAEGRYAVYVVRVGRARRTAVDQRARRRDRVRV